MGEEAEQRPSRILRVYWEKEMEEVGTDLENSMLLSGKCDVKNEPSSCERRRFDGSKRKINIREGEGRDSTCKGIDGAMGKREEVKRIPSGKTSTTVS